MVAALTRIFRIKNLDLAEDVVQEAFGKAIAEWRFRMPENPSGWLMVTAKNKAIDAVRRQRYQREFAEESSALLKSGYTAAPLIENLFLDHEIQDSQLRMIFACCHPSLAEADQIALTLKTCSAFSIQEVASALMTDPEVIKKRLQRARHYIKEEGIRFDIPAGDELKKRLDTVLHTIYLIFNEGYNSGSKEQLIRKDLCEEAIRLSLLLTQHAVTQNSKCFALVSLLCLQASRFDARIDDSGSIILLEDQDRNKWNQPLINIGMEYFQRAMRRDELTQYHLEASIVAEHSMSPDFPSTNWQRILSLYDLLRQINPSPAVLLNRAIVVGRIRGPQTAIDEIMAIPKIETLVRSYYLFPATLGELHRQCGETERARELFRAAVTLTNSPTEKALLRRKLADL